VTAAVEASEGALSVVERTGELEAFNATISKQQEVLRNQISTFDRLATEGSGDDARLAADASAATVKVLVALNSYLAAVLDRHLTDALYGSVQMHEGVEALDAVAAEWTNLQ
jgi:hypothetical protein